MPGSEPSEYTTPSEQTKATLGYGVDPAAALVEIPEDERIEARNIIAFAHAFYAAAFEHINGFRAVEVLGMDFLRGDVPIAPGELQRLVCDHIERERLRFGKEDRNRVLRPLFDDAKLDGYIARLADACIAFDLSRCPGDTGSPLPRVAARLIVRRTIEDLQRHLSNEGAGGVGVIAEEATAQVVECANILDHEDIGAYVPGRDIFQRIVWLTKPEEHATAQEARRGMTVGSAGRPLFLELAKEVGGLDTTSDGGIETICELAVEYQFAKGTIGRDLREVEDKGRSAGDEHGREVIFFRGRRSA